MASSSLSLLHPPLLPLKLRLTSISSKPTNFHSFLNPSNPSSSSLSLHFNSSPNHHVSLITIPNSYPHKRKTQVWRIYATTSDQVEQITSSSGGDTGVATIIQVLLFIAFVGLTILTVGVIYIATTDFLTKREREKFEKEEAEKKKKRSGKKVVVRAKTGPRGFGQKIDEDDFDI